MEPLKTNNLVLKEKYVNHDSELDGTSQTSMCVEEEPMDDILNVKEKIFHNASNAAHQIPSDDPKRKPANPGGKLQEHNDEEGNSQLYKSTKMMVLKERAPNFTESMLIDLMSMIRDRHKVINNKSTVHIAKDRKNKAWEEVTSEFNAVYPDQYRSTKQLKARYENAKNKVKDASREFKKKNKYIAGDSSPAKPQPKHLIIAASMMQAELAMGNNVFETFTDTLDASETEGSMSPTSPLPSDEDPSPPSPGVSTVPPEPPQAIIRLTTTPHSHTHSQGKPHGHICRRKESGTAWLDSLEPTTITTKTVVRNNSAESSVRNPPGHPSLPKGSGTARRDSVEITTVTTKTNPGIASIITGNTESSTSKQQGAATLQRRLMANEDADLCRRRQEYYHKLKIYQMKEIHALEVEERKLAIEKYKMEINNLNKMNIALDIFQGKITMVCNAAKRSYDSMAGLN